MLKLFLVSYFFTEGNNLRNLDSLKHITSLNKESSLLDLDSHSEILNELKKNQA